MRSRGCRWLALTTFALGALLGALSPAPASADVDAKRAIEAAAWAAENPEACALLDDAQARGKMDGLLLKLATLCGRPDLVGGVAQEANESAPDAFGTDVRANDPAGDSGASRTQSETSVAVNETTGTLCSGYNDSFHGVTQGQGYTGWSRSTNGGVSWTDLGALGATSFGDPAIVWRKSDGNFYFAALHSTGLGVWRSTNDCTSFPFLGMIHSGGGDDKELMAVDNNLASPHYGRLYVVWTDFNAGARIFETHSDNGTTWSTPVGLSTAGVDVQGAWPAVAPNGDVYAAWVRWNPWPSGPMDVEVARSTNGGVSYALVANPMTAGGNPQAAGPTAACGRPALNGNIRYLPSPQIAVGPDGVVHVIYAKDPDGMGTGDVVNSYYRRSTTNGASWDAEVQLNDVGTNDQFFATLSVGATNIVSASWYDRRLDAANLRVRYFGRTSFNGGVTWGANVQISDTDSPVVLDPNLATCYHGDYDTQIQSATAAVIVWSDDRGIEGGNNPDVWTDTVPLSTDFLVVPTPGAQTICAGTVATVNIDVPSFSGFTSPVTLSVTGNPGFGATAGFSVNPVTPPGSSVLTIGSTGAVPSGSYPMTIDGVSGTITHSGSSTLDVVAGAPSAPTLVSPPDGASGVPTVPTLTWTAAAGAATYLVEVDNNADFLSPEYSATVAGTTTVASGLSPDLTYYWRVRADNICGNATSTVFDFRTGPVSCNTPALAIPDNNPTGVTNDMVLALAGTLDDLDVSIDATHTWVGDLIFSLTHVDTGTSVTFYDRPGYTGTGFGCSGNDIDVTANDEGPDGTIEAQCANLPAIFGDRVGGDPANNALLAAFDGENLAGTWRLTASDSAGGDTGTLTEWCLLPRRQGPGLSLAKTVGTVPAVCAATDSITVATGTPVFYCFHVENTGVVALNFHDLVDDHLGTLLSNAPISLPPGATYDHIVSNTAMATVTNTATWTGADSAGGFAVDDTIPYNFEDITGTGTALSLGDDVVSGALPIGFTFDYFGVNYTDTYIGSNGFLTFLPGQSSGCCTGQPIPSVGSPDAIIAAWWEDLYPPAGGTVHYQTLGVAPNRYFIAQYTNIPHFSSGNLVTMQVKLFEGTNVIEVHYQAAPSDGGTHSAGVENELGTVGVQYALQATGLTTPLAVQYTPATPVSASATDSATVTIADPDIVVTPAGLSSTLPPGQTDTQQLDIGNIGTGNLDWTLEEAPPVPQASIPPSDGSFQRGKYPVSAGPAPSEVQRSMPAVTGPELALGLNNAYSWNSNGEYYSVFDITNPAVLPNVAAFPVSPNFIGAGEYVDGLVYMIDTVNNMWEVDPATGAILRTFTATAPPGAETYSGLALDPTSAVVYAASTSCGTSSLFTMDVLTGAATYIGAVTNAACLIALAADGNGDLWGYDIIADVLVSIDKATGAGTVIGSIGFDANYGQGMGWNPATDTLYMAAFNNASFQGELRSVDRATGNTTLVGVLGSTTPGGLNQLSWLGLEIGLGPCSSPADLPWVSVSPTSGTILPGGTSPVQVTFDSTGLTGGTYAGFLCIHSNDPDERLVEVPVTLTVDLMPFIDGFETGNTSRWSFVFP